MDRAFLAELTEAVADVDAPVTLVIDDFQEIADTQTLAGVADFVSALPDHLHLVIGSRRDPSIRLHRLRLDGRLREVRGRDLAFLRDEVEAVLRHHGVTLAPDDLLALWQRTEGWPAAVRLASLALAQEPDTAGFVARFAGEHSAVSSYLVAEILDRQPEALRRFLLDTCVATELTAELAATLSGRSDAGAILDDMARANALVQRLGRSGEWYRFHVLLRSYLLAELRRRDLTAGQARHRTAALWFDEVGMAEPALEHAVAAGDHALILSMLSHHGIRLLLMGKIALVTRAIADSPAAVRRDPSVVLLSAITAFESGDRLAGDLALARFRADPQPVRGRSVGRLYELTRLHQARLHGDVGALAATGTDPPLDSTEPLDDDVELLMLANRGALRIAAGDYRGAMTDLLPALELSRRRGHHRLTLDCLNHLTGVTVGLNEADQSVAWVRRTAEFASEHGWANSPQLAYSYLIGAWWAYLRLDLQEATRQVATATTVLDGGAVEPEAEYATRSGAAIIAFDRFPHRRSALRDITAIWRPPLDFLPSPALAAYALGAHVRMCLTLGDRPRAAATLAVAAELLAGTADVAVMRAWELLDRHQHERARALVGPVVGGTQSCVVVTTHISAWLVEALAAARSGRVEAAHRALLAALQIGADSTLMRPFYDLGAPVRELLIATVGRTGALEPFLSRLLSAWQTAEDWQAATLVDEPDAAREHRRSATLAAPLTGREIEMLRDLPSMMTTEEIAEEHQVSVNTVKTHLRSLYRKLGASNRRDAVANARRLSLL
jgi:LuxR family maltose regulon positive regulatory protein